MEQGLFGLAGVFLGATLAAVIRALDRQRGDTATVRRVIRLVDAEFASAQRAVDGALELLKYWYQAGQGAPLLPALSIQAWETHQGELAAFPMPDAQLEAIVKAATHIEGAEVVVSLLGPADAKEEGVREILGAKSSSIAAGRKALADLRPAEQPEPLQMMVGR